MLRALPAFCVIEYRHFDTNSVSVDKFVQKMYFVFLGWVFFIQRIVLLTQFLIFFRIFILFFSLRPAEHNSRWLANRLNSLYTGLSSLYKKNSEFLARFIVLGRLIRTTRPAFQSSRIKKFFFLCGIRFADEILIECHFQWKPVHKMDSIVIWKWELVKQENENTAPFLQNYLLL